MSQKCVDHPFYGMRMLVPHIRSGTVSRMPLSSPLSHTVFNGGKADV